MQSMTAHSCVLRAVPAVRGSKGSVDWRGKAQLTSGQCPIRRSYDEALQVCAMPPYDYLLIIVIV